MDCQVAPPPFMVEMFLLKNSSTQLLLFACLEKGNAAGILSKALYVGTGWKKGFYCLSSHFLFSMKNTFEVIVSSIFKYGKIGSFFLHFPRGKMWPKMYAHPSVRPSVLPQHYVTFGQKLDRRTNCWRRIYPPQNFSYNSSRFWQHSGTWTFSFHSQTVCVSICFY